MDPKEMAVGEKGQSLSAPDGLRMTLLETPAASGGHALEIEWRVPPGNRLVAADHYHPEGPEVWRVLEGTAGYRLVGREHTEAAPHEYTVPAGTSHGHPWNAGERTLVVRQLIASPEEPIAELTGGVQGFFETLFAYSQTEGLNEKGEISDRLQWALTIHDLLMPGSFLAGVPRVVQSPAFAAIAAIARAFGRTAYREPRFDSE